MAGLRNEGAVGSQPRPLHVGVFLSTLGVLPGGLETIALNLALELAEFGHTVAVVAGGPPPVDVVARLSALPAEWITLPYRSLDHRSTLAWLGRRPGLALKVRSLTFSLAAWLSSPARSVLSGADVSLSFLEVETVALSWLRRRYGAPHMSYFPGVIDRRWLRRDKSSVRVSISATIADTVAGRDGLRIDGVVRPGVPAAWLDVPYEVRPAAKTLLFVGRLETNKGVTELLAIFERLGSEMPDLTLRLIGAGPLQGQIKRRLSATGLAARVALLGAIPSERVRDELQGADLFVFPTHYESFGIAPVEAQAVGVPVVASDIPALREALGDAAHLVPLGDTDRWIAALRSLIQDRPARERLSRSGRERASRRTWRRSALELERYLHLAARRRSPRTTRSSQR